MRPVTLVTGGTGFLGAHLVAQLAERGERVRVLTRGGAGELDGLGVELAQGDVTGDLGEAFEGVETVYHLAGFVSRDPDDG